MTTCGRCAHTAVLRRLNRYKEEEDTFYNMHGNHFEATPSVLLQ